MSLKTLRYCPRGSPFLVTVSVVPSASSAGTAGAPFTVTVLRGRSSPAPDAPGVNLTESV